jgi:HEAT repeat protein
VHRLLPAVFAVVCAGLSGCAGFWDDVTSKDFTFKGMFVTPDPLVVLRDSNDGDKRARALSTLGEPAKHGRTQEDQDTVLKILVTAASSEKQALCRAAAMQSLGKIKDQRAVDGLVNAYYAVGEKYQPDTASVLRCHALTALGETGNPAAVEHLVLVLRQPKAKGPDQDQRLTMDERIAAARALGHFKHQQATEALVTILKTEKDVALRDRANEALVAATGKELPPDAAAWDTYIQSAGGAEALASQNKSSKFSLIGFFQKSE